MKSEIAIVCWMLTQLSHCKIPLVGRAKSLRSWPSCLWLPRSNSNGYLTSCTHPGELVIRCETQNTTHQSVCRNIYRPMSLSGVEFSLIKHRWFLSEQSFDIGVTQSVTKLGLSESGGTRTIYFIIQYCQSSFWHFLMTEHLFSLTRPPHLHYV